MFASVLCLLLLAVVGLGPMVALASPATPVVNTSSLSWTPAPDHQTTCESPATFASDPSLEPADWRECAAMYSSWAAENGTFRLLPGKKLGGTGGENDETVAAQEGGDNGGPVVLLRETDCVLAVRPMDPTKAPFTVGDRDVYMLLGESLKKFSHGTEVAVSGVVKCADVGGEKAGLMWQLAKTVE
ncbi:necrosis-inducing factor domain-containing protein [Purpureocillium lavendulum]|uniref:Necrosis-inducing factor domain-containing protein n=1 Tax=Purpureocillium lavendulum TaxID=1247861 RepID=A0AB34FKP1_9HYPO|nr:necrosis-inducing factor domain-containing protein [Purpureocillium lavendulum]